MTFIPSENFVNFGEFREAAPAFAQMLTFGRIARLLRSRWGGVVFEAYESRNGVPEGAARLAYIRYRSRKDAS